LQSAYDQRGVAVARSSQAARLTVRIEATLGRGDLTGARVLIDQLGELLGDIAHAAEHSAPRRVIALHHLVSGQPDRARGFLGEVLPALHTAHPPLTPRFVLLQILLAEAQRRCGDAATAVRTLQTALAAAGRTDFQQSLTATLCAALIAADLGDDEASRRLAAYWDSARHEHGLPVPIGFTAGARTLGLDTASPTGHPSRWNQAILTACVDSARTWCEHRLSGHPTECQCQS
jgi:ATP/maltotriose-dependent transcriptional regulator MalT